MPRYEISVVISRELTRFTVWSEQPTIWQAERVSPAEHKRSTPDHITAATPEEALARAIAGAPIFPPIAPIQADPWNRQPDVEAAVRPDSTPPAPETPVPFVTREERAAGLQATIDAALERLAEALRAGHSAEYLSTLQFYSRFHRYSWQNTLLIASQCPGATRVAGLRRWNELGYRIRAGEKAIWIWAPIVKKEADQLTGEVVEAVVGFKPAPVFDASQLANVDEKPLPEFVPALPDDAEPLYRSVKASIEAQGIVVEERRLPGSIYGMSEGGRITVRQGLDSRNRLFVLLHEFAHELAHHGEAQQAKPVEQREFEAESAAYVVAATLGLDHPTAADYLLTYDATPEVLRVSMATVQGLVRRLLRAVDDVTCSELGSAA